MSLLYFDFDHETLLKNRGRLPPMAEALFTAKASHWMAEHVEVLPFSLAPRMESTYCKFPYHLSRGFVSFFCGGLRVVLRSFLLSMVLVILVGVVLGSLFYAQRRPAATFEVHRSNYSVIAGFNVILAAFNLFGGFEYWKSAVWFIREEGLSFEACTLHSSYFGPWVFAFVLLKVGGDMMNLFLRLSQSSSPSMRPTFAYIFPRVTNMILCYLCWAFRVEFFGLFAGLTYIDDSFLYVYYVLQVRFDVYTVSKIVSFIQWSHTLKQGLVIALLIHNIINCNTNPFVIELSLVIVVAQLALNLYNTYATKVPTARAKSE